MGMRMRNCFTCGKYDLIDDSLHCEACKSADCIPRKDVEILKRDVEDINLFAMPQIEMKEIIIYRLEKLLEVK